MEGVIETERLRLRAPEPGDARRITEYIGDFDVAKMLARVPHPYTLKDAQDWLASLPQRAAKGDSFVRAIDFGGLIGMVGLHDMREIEGEKIGEIGYWLAKPYWGRGFMTEAASAFVRHAFETLGLIGLKSGYFKENARSARVLGKLGFRGVGEGLMKCMARGAAIPHVDLVLTRAAWREHIAKRAA